MFRRSKQIVIELDGRTYSFSDNKLEEVSDFKDVKGNKWLISDMQQAISRTMTVEAPGKYADVMVRKKLQEAGEFDEPVAVVTHWKKKKGKDTTDIFFTALPTRLYFRYLDEIKEDEDVVLLFPIFSVLFGLLKHMRTKTPVTIVFQHNRFADLIIGTAKRIFYASRCVAFDTSEEQIARLWDMVRTDITNIEAENRIKVDSVFLLTWIDSAQVPVWPEDAGSEFYCMEEESISFNGESHDVSFLNAVRMLSGIRAISPRMEKLCYYSCKALPYLNALLFFAILLFAAGYFWFDGRANLLETQIKAVNAEIARVQKEAPLREVPYKETLAFAKELACYRAAPSYEKVVNDISENLQEGMLVDVLKVDYAKDSVNIEIFGNVKASFEVAYRGYQKFENGLRRRGYNVVKSQFDTKIQQSEFLIKLRKKIL
ncbi:MAG: hypothetical protein DRH50_08465 [Deltaproteobacteria bacterium]|nr:MAG: hypothetical protein DRH50_08465 [Deltaproteobacteria bacterium]